METKDWIVLGFAGGAAVIAVIACLASKSHAADSKESAKDAESEAESIANDVSRCHRSASQAEASSKMAWQWALICRPKGPDDTKNADDVWKEEFGREPTEPYPEVCIEFGGEAGGS
jgi:hypothetical protein